MTRSHILTTPVGFDIMVLEIEREVLSMRQKRKEEDE